MFFLCIGAKRIHKRGNIYLFLFLFIYVRLLLYLCVLCLQVTSWHAMIEDYVCDGIWEVPVREAVANQNKHNNAKRKKFSTERTGKTNVQRLLLSATCLRSVAKPTRHGTSSFAGRSKGICTILQPTCWWCGKINAIE